MAGGLPGAPGIYTQDQIEGWKKVLDLYFLFHHRACVHSILIH